MRSVKREVGETESIGSPEIEGIVEQFVNHIQHKVSAVESPES